MTFGPHRTTPGSARSHGSAECDSSGGESSPLRLRCPSGELAPPVEEPGAASQQPDSALVRQTEAEGARRAGAAAVTAAAASGGWAGCAQQVCSPRDWPGSLSKSTSQSQPLSPLSVRRGGGVTYKRRSKTNESLFGSFAQLGVGGNGEGSPQSIRSPAHEGGSSGEGWPMAGDLRDCADLAAPHGWSTDEEEGEAVSAEDLPGRGHGWHAEDDEDDSGESGLHDAAKDVAGARALPTQTLADLRSMLGQILPEANASKLSSADTTLDSSERNTAGHAPYFFSQQPRGRSQPQSPLARGAPIAITGNLPRSRRPSSNLAITRSWGADGYLVPHPSEVASPMPAAALAPGPIFNASAAAHDREGSPVVMRRATPPREHVSPLALSTGAVEATAAAAAAGAAITSPRSERVDASERSSAAASGSAAKQQLRELNEIATRLLREIQPGYEPVAADDEDGGRGDANVARIALRALGSIVSHLRLLVDEARHPDTPPDQSAASAALLALDKLRAGLKEEPTSADDDGACKTQ